MTYKEYDNIELEGSGTICPTLRFVGVRNGPPVEMGTSRTYENFNGDWDRVGYSVNGTFLDEVSCCSEQYIYYIILPDDLYYGDIVAHEYEIATGTIKSVTLYSNPDSSSWRGFIAYLEGRKVICYPGNDAEELLYIVDFEDLSKTDINEEFVIWAVSTAQRENRDIYIIINSLNVLYIKNYTQNGVWNSVSINPNWVDYSFVQDRYWVSPYTNGYNLYADIVDIVNGTVQTTNGLVMATGEHNTRAFLRGLGGDYETGCVYCIGTEARPDNIYFPDHYASVMEISKIDPVAATITSVYTDSSHPNLVGSGVGGYIKTSKNYAYCFKTTPSGTGNIIRCHNLSNVGTFPQYYMTFYGAQLMNDDESYWFVDETDDTIKHRSLSGDTIGSYSIPNRAHPYTGWLDNLNNSLVYCENMQQSSSFNHWYSIYVLV